MKPIVKKTLRMVSLKNTHRRYSIMPGLPSKINLVLSFQAAYTAPIIMMSQNQQSQIARQDTKHDYGVNLKSELEIELLYDKINLLPEEEIFEVLQLLKLQGKPLELMNLLQSQQVKLDQLEQKFDILISQKS